MGVIRCIVSIRCRFLPFAARFANGTGRGTGVVCHVVEYGCHALVSIDADGDQEADFIQLSCFEEGSVDMASATYGKTFHAELPGEDIRCFYQIGTVGSDCDIGDAFVLKQLKVVGVACSLVMTSRFFPS